MVIGYLLRVPSSMHWEEQDRLVARADQFMRIRLRMVEETATGDRPVALRVHARDSEGHEARWRPLPEAPTAATFATSFDGLPRADSADGDVRYIERAFAQTHSIAGGRYRVELTHVQGARELHDMPLDLVIALSPPRK